MSARRRHQRSIRYLAAASIAALAATACSSSASPGTTASSGPLTIGMSLPMTGPVADVSKSGLQGYQLWASQQNASGGLLGHQLKLDVLDDGFDPNQTATDYTRLISQDKVNLVLGTFSSLLNAPASAIAARQGMLYVEPSGGAASLFTRGFTNLFFAQPGTTTSEPDRFVAWIASLPPSQRPATAAYVTQDDPSASPAVAVFQTRLRALGVKTVYDQTYDPSTTNFDSIAASIAHARPQLVIQGAVADDGAAFVRSLEKINFSPRMLFQTNAPSDSAYPAAIGRSNAEGVFTAEAWSPQAKVLAAALRAVGRVDQKALAAWLHTHTVSTIVGPLKWNSAGDPEGSLLLAQWQGGKLQIVAPKSAATTSHIVTVKPAWAS